ncbi:MAG: hypothetical protein ACE5D8_01530 [Fidelibacterota bacterium]
MVVAATIALSQTTSSIRFYNGWGIWSAAVSPDSIVFPYRVEYYQDHSLAKIQFFDEGGKFVKQHEYVYADERLSRIIVLDDGYHVKNWYQLDYDPLLMSWKLQKRTARGEYVGSVYINDLFPDSTDEDSEFLIGLPGIVYPEK